MRKHGKEIGRNSSQGIRRLALVGIVVAVLALVAAAAVSLRTSQARDSAKDSAARQNNGDTRANTSLRSSAQPMPFAVQTGQIRPLTQEEAQKLAEGIKQLVNQSTDGLKSVRHADGSVSLDLEGRFQSVAVAKRDEDGKLILSCVDNRQAAAAFFGIDPQLVGVPANAASSKTGSAVTEKGGDR
jgi:hypothetical protein